MVLDAAKPPLNSPIKEIVCDCALAANGHATAAPPTKLMNFRRLTG
jgi:hypothetical protein